MRSEFTKPLEGFLREGNEDYIGLWQIVSDVSTALKIDERGLTISKTNKLWQGLQVSGSNGEEM